MFCPDKQSKCISYNCHHVISSLSPPLSLLISCQCPTVSHPIKAKKPHTQKSCKSAIQYREYISFFLLSKCISTSSLTIWTAVCSTGYRVDKKNNTAPDHISMSLLCACLKWQTYSCVALYDLSKIPSNTIQSQMYCVGKQTSTPLEWRWNNSTL